MRRSASGRLETVRVGDAFRLKQEEEAREFERVVERRFASGEYPGLSREAIAADLRAGLEASRAALRKLIDQSDAEVVAEASAFYDIRPEDVSRDIIEAYLEAIADRAGN